MPPAAQTTLERKVEQIAASLEGDEGIRVRLALVEQGLAEHRTQSATQHAALMLAVAGIREDLSDQGRTPPPAPESSTKSGGWRLHLAPGTGRELGLLILAVVGAVGGPVAGYLISDSEASVPPPIAAPAPPEQP
jgi:hypothetical protein